MNFFQRRTVRKYTDEVICDEDIKEILKAGLTSPTGRNTRAVEFILLKDKNLLKTIAESKKPLQDMAVNSAFSILVIGDTEKGDTWIENCSAALTTMQLKAWDLNIGSCWVQLRARKNYNDENSEDLVKNLLNIPENYGILALMTFGKINQETKEYTDEDIDFNRVHMEYFK